MRRKEMLFAAIGGVIGAVLTMVVGSFSPLGAQSQFQMKGHFGTIVCTQLEVIGAGGQTMVELAVREDGGFVDVHGKDKLVGAYASIDVAEHGGRVRVIGKDEKSFAIMNINEDGGEVIVVGKDIKPQASMKIIDHGGVLVAVYGGDGKSAALMGISEKYGGMVGVTDKNGVTTLLNPD